MHHSRLLNFHNARMQNHLGYWIPTELRYLKWKGYPLEFLPLSSEEYRLIEINMCYSNLKQFWLGEKHLEELKYIKLNHSQKLFKTPDFAKIPNLERLELEGCMSLINIHPSIFYAEKLVFLSLKDCINLTNLPRHINIKVLEVLILSGCSKLKKIPEFSGNTDRLLQLHLDDTSITDLPSSLASLHCLRVLSLKNCKKLISIPTTIDKMMSLQSLNLFGCSKLENQKRKVEDVGCLEELNMTGTARRRRDDHNQVRCDIIIQLFLWFYKTPMSGIFDIPLLAGLYSLTKLNLMDCNLKAIPEGIECLVSLTELNLCGNSFSQLPKSISQLHNLKRLNINRCNKLLYFPELPSRILRVMSKDCISLKNVPDISKVDHSYFMIEVNLLNCHQLADNKGLHRLITSWMQKMFFRKGTFNIMIPGSEIPDWFTMTKMGSSISIEWDPNAQKANLIRFALCVVCGPSNRDDSTDVPFAIIASVTGKNLNDPDFKGDLIVNGFTVSGMRKLDHIWLFVLPRTKSLTRKISKCREIKFRFLIQDNYSQSVTSNIKLKKCGVCLINMEEEEEAMKRYASYIILKNKMRLQTM